MLNALLPLAVGVGLEPLLTAIIGLITLASVGGATAATLRAAIHRKA